MSFNKIKFLKDYFKYLDNPIECLLFKFNLKREVIVKPKNSNLKIKLTKISSLNYLMTFIKNVDLTDEFREYMLNIDSDEEIINTLYDIKIFNPKFHQLNSIFIEYYTDYYSKFNIDYKNKIIIDIGSNSGDSPLFFASKGAKVYGFEPMKEHYNMSLENLKLNPNLSVNIELYNYAVSYKNGKLNINSMNSVANYIQDSYYEVDIISLNDIIERIEPNFLKMDCEGCEFEIIEHCDLSKFNEIIFEHHAKMVGKKYDLLTTKLKKEGFKIKTFKVFDKDFNDIGLIYCYK